MRQPLWIINSTLLLFTLLLLLLLYFFRVTIPEREEIEPTAYIKPKKEKIKTNIAKIYENDLFGTYQPDVPKLTDRYSVPPFPEPPRPLTASVPEIPTPKFLDPLDITLKGIFVVTTDPSKNRAMVLDNKTNKEATYRVGDQMDGAQLIRIYSNKVVFLRPNGQQEVLYLREQDAKLDPTYAAIDDWGSVIQPLGQNGFVVDPQLFGTRVSNLGVFIELVGLSTAYKQGKSVGCRIGQAEPKSLGAALGLQVGDIITAINGIPATTTENRLKIYKEIVNKRDGDTIKVQLLRNKQDFSLEYTLKEFAQDWEGASTQPGVLLEMEKREKEEILRQKYTFAPTLQEIKKRERQAMMQKGRAPLVRERYNIKDDNDGKPK